jgi:ATP-dependent Clp protease ATP-binding subunit ClpX
MELYKMVKCSKCKKDVIKLYRLNSNSLLCLDCLREANLEAIDKLEKEELLDEKLRNKIRNKDINLTKEEDLILKEKILKMMTGENNSDNFKLKLSKDKDSPRKIKEILDDYVIGQEEAKKVISMSVYNHYKRINSDYEEKVKIEKSNVLLLGPSGTGKTLLAKTIAEDLDLPLAIVDATSLTQAGYQGDDVESILTSLYREAGQNISKAEQGIIFIDEIDKIAKNKGERNSTKGVLGEAVQQALLKIIEGTEIAFPLSGTKMTPQGEIGVINTENILFICSGSFNGLEDIIKERLGKETGGNTMGFQFKSNNKKDKKSKKQENLFKELKTDDLINFGFINEFIGRVPIRVSLNKLEKKDLKRIFVEPKNSILAQYIYMFLMDNIDLSFEEGFIDSVVEEVIKEGTGARGFKSIVDIKMTELMFNIDKYRGQKVLVKKEYFKNQIKSNLTIKNLKVEIEKQIELN